MEIRKTSPCDYERVCQIYSDARKFMQASGNPDQWGDAHPRVDLILQDIEQGLSYVCVDRDNICAVFYYNVEVDPTYAKIDGQWLNDAPYGVVHRIASSRSVKGAGDFCLRWCLKQCQNLRIDTHKDNAPMLNLLRRLEFKYCGIIWIENGDERMAYQRLGGGGPSF